MNKFSFYQEDFVRYKYLKVWNIDKSITRESKPESKKSGYVTLYPSDKSLFNKSFIHSIFKIVLTL